MAFMRFSSCRRCRHFPVLVEFLEFSASIPVALLLLSSLLKTRKFVFRQTAAFQKLVSMKTPIALVF